MDLVFWLYLSCGFLGFLLEVAYAHLAHCRKQDRKCHLFLPVCPVYGLGALAILLLPPWVKADPLLLLPAGALCATAVEWSTCLFYEKATGTAFWDYSALPWNLEGRVCLPFSLSWGILAFPLVYGVLPWVERWAAAVPGVVTIAAAAVYAADAGASLLLLRRSGTQALRWYVRLRPSEAR